MIGNILKVLTALIIGYLVGLLLGGVIGIVVGLIASFLIGESITLNQSILMSVLFSAGFGGLLGFLEVRIFNRMFDTNDKPFLGALVGVPFGLIFGVFTYFILDLSTQDALDPGFHSNVMIYIGAMGSRIGSAIFSVFSAAQTVRELIRFHRGVTQLK